MQIGEVSFRPGRTVKRFDVGRELNQIAGDKTRGESQVAQQLNQKPTGIAARSRSLAEGFFRRLHAGFKADQVLNRVGKAAVEFDEKIYAAGFFARNRGQVACKEHVVPLFDASKAYKAGSTIPIKLQVLNAANAN